MERRTVIVGLSVIRKLMNGEDVELPSLGVNLIPDDVLHNGARRATELGAWGTQQACTLEELEAILNSEDPKPVRILPDGSVREI